VAGRDVLGAEFDGMIEEGPELDLGVAQHVRIGRAPGGVLAQEIGEDPLAVLGGEIDRLDVDLEPIGDAVRIDPVLPGRAVFVVVIVFPVLHEQADDLVALLLEQPGRNGGVDPARQANDNPRARARRRRQACAFEQFGIRHGTGTRATAASREAQLLNFRFYKNRSARFATPTGAKRLSGFRQGESKGTFMPAALWPPSSNEEKPCESAFRPKPGPARRALPRLPKPSRST